MIKNKAKISFLKIILTKYNIIFIFQLLLTAFFLVQVCLVDCYPISRWQIDPLFTLLGILGLIFFQFIVIKFRSFPEQQVFPYNRLSDKKYLCIILIFLIFCYLFYANGGSHFGVDDKKYYAYVKSFVIDGDLDFTNEYMQLEVQDPYHLHFRTKAGRPPNIYPPGSMVLWLPFFILTHVLLKISRLFDPGLLTNGILQSYRNAVGLATIFYACLTFFLIYRMLKEYVKKSLALITVLIFLLSTFLIYYIIFTPLMSTVCEAFMVTLFILLWLKNRKKKNLKLHLLIGIAAGLLIFIRPTLGIFLLLPLIDTIRVFPFCLKNKNWQSLKKELNLILGLIAGTVLGAMPLLFIWKAVYGEWIVSFSRYFPWLKSPFLLQVLFSWRHGLISWSPIILFCLSGLIILCIKHKNIGIPFIFIFLITLYINASQKDWWAGGSFGARRFASLTPLFCFGLAFFLQWIKNTLMLKGSIVVLIFLTLLIPWNLLLLHQFENNLISRVESASPKIIINNNRNILFHKLPDSLQLTGFWIKGLSFGIKAKQYQMLKNYKSFAGDFQIDIGSDDEPFIGKNWGIKDRKGNTTFRWSLRGFSTLLLPLKETSPYLLLINCWPYTYPNAPPQSIKLKINGKKLSAIPLNNRSTRYYILIPKEYLKKGINEIKIFSAYSIRPSSFNQNLDPRRISIAYDYFSFSRRK